MQIRKQKTIALLLFINIIFSCLGANALSDTVIRLHINEPLMTVNNEYTEIDPEGSAVPVIYNGRTLLPIRSIIEALGGSVTWNEASRSVTLSKENNSITLTIGSTKAYQNSKEKTLDAAPQIINDRTMLPVRFISESFGLAVGWDENTQTVLICEFKNGPGISDEDIPQYTGTPCKAVNENLPVFTELQVSDISYEFYSPLDSLKRCGFCIASVGADLMPSSGRGSISDIHPTAWHSVKYDNIDGKYLYNRCHLIGYQLTAENANERNLITGTRYLNVKAMLPFENMVASYIKETGNHVMYRSTPYFKDDNLLSGGVLLEGYSVEDEGAGVNFCVYCYNVQPGINIDYKTGDSAFAGGTEIEENSENISGCFIINTATKKIHLPACKSAAKINDENKEISFKTKEDLMSLGFSPCGICKP